MTDEFSRIARYFAPLTGPEGRGLTDDAAVLSPQPGRDLVLTVDQMLEGIHFLPNDAPDLIARKLLRRNLSDLAAMGAVPRGYLLTTALPSHIGDAWLEAFTQGLARDQQSFNIKLFGGDSASSLDKISLTATFIGDCATGTAISRGGAQPGDDIFVTGTIGDAALGLQARLGKLQNIPESLITRSLLPEPRIGLKLAEFAHAAIDISDGLIQDLGHICTASNLAATIHAPLIPFSNSATPFAAAMLESMLTDGDDYELLLAIPPDRSNEFLKSAGHLRLTKIGTFTAGHPAVTLLDQNHQQIKFQKSGWQHFPPIQ